MFLGHFGAGYASKAAAPRVSLGTLFLGAQFLDLLWPTLLLLGVERVRIDPGATAVTPLDFVSYPVSHSLLAVTGWATLVGLVYWGVRRSLRGSLVLGIVVVSHWVLDAIVHRPDLPLAPGSDLRVGLGLWSSPAATLLVEVAIFGAGVWLYARTTRPSGWKGILGLWILTGGLLAIHLASTFGPPPPDTAAIAWVGQAQWLLVVAAYWLDRHRTVRPPRAAGERPA